VTPTQLGRLKSSKETIVGNLALRTRSSLEHARRAELAFANRSRGRDV
jgi:hypothetical protein